MNTEPVINCPMCGEEIKSIAKKCKHCKEILDDSLKGNAGASQLSVEEQEKIRQELSDLSISTGKYIGLMFATGGLYSLFNLFRISSKFNKLFGKSMNSAVLLAIAITWGLSCFMDAVTSVALSGWQQMHSRELEMSLELYDHFSTLGCLLGWVAMILSIIISFQMKKGIEEYSKNTLKKTLKLNPVATFFLSYIYINHSIYKLTTD